MWAALAAGTICWKHRLVRYQILDEVPAATPEHIKSVEKSTNNRMIFRKPTEDLTIPFRMSWQI
jgi:hypothetical protein